MAIIKASTRLPTRIAVLIGISASTLIGFAGAQNTIAHWNGEKTNEIAFNQDVEAQRLASIAAIEAKEREIANQAKLAESYSDLGTKQANCGDTLSQFYFSPGGNLTEQLNIWGLDWGTPRYNTDRWFPLFDSSQVLFAAIRMNPSTGQQEIVAADQQSLNQASICNRNVLSD